MKKLFGIIASALSVVLMLSFLFGVSAFASTEEPEAMAENKFVISTNVSYDDNIHLLIALDKTKIADSALISVNIRNSEGKLLLSGLKVDYEVEDLYKNDEVATPACVVRTLGVSAKDMSNLYTIEVFYGGELQETTQYSVLRYFLDRLYGDGIINATEGDDLKRRTLYLTTLRWGQAAETVLNKQDSHISDYCYASVEGVGATILNGESLALTLPKGYWIVSQYNVSGQLVNKSFETEGDIAISGFCNIESIKLTSYVTPDGVETFDGASLPVIVTDGTATAQAVVSGTTNLKVGVYKQQPAVTTFTVENKDGDSVLRHAKTGYTSTSSAQSWNVFERNTVSAGQSVMFEAKMSVAAGASKGYYRLYTTRTAANPTGGKHIGGGTSSTAPTLAFSSKDGKWLLSSGGFNGTDGNIIPGSSYSFITDIPFTQELIFRMVIDSDDTVTLYYVNSEGYFVTVASFVTTGAYNATGIIYSCDSKHTVTTDFDDVYYGPLANEFTAIPMLK